MGWKYLFILILQRCHRWRLSKDRGIDTNIEVIVVSLTTWEANHSPRALPSGCGELPRWLMRQQWLKLRYQFLFYHDETQIMMNKQILSIQMLKKSPKTVPCLQHGYMCPSWDQVTWLFLLGNMCSNHCDVTVRFATLNSNCILNQNRKKSIIIHGKHININQKVLIRWYFENTNYLQWLNCLILNTPVFYLIFVTIVLIRVCFLKPFQSWV